MEANAKAEFKKVKDNHNNAIIKFKWLILYII
jgi:hypothetical protein